MEDVFIVIGDFLEELIIDKAFNRKKKLSKRIPYIIIYYITILSVISLSAFIGINYILIKNIVGYVLVVAALVFSIFLFLPIWYKGNNNSKTN